MHVDFSYDNPGPFEAGVLELGGTLLRPKEGYSVYADPAGHPFCVGQPGA